MSLTEIIVDSLPVNMVLSYYILWITSQERGKREQMYLSPFKEENTPSLSGSDSKKIWKDFSTGKGGNVITFVMEYKKISYFQAIEELNNTFHLGLQLRHLTPEEKERERRRNVFYTAMRKAIELYIEELTPEDRQELESVFPNLYIDKKYIGKFSLEAKEKIEATIGFEQNFNLFAEQKGRYVIPLLKWNSPLGFLFFDVEDKEITNETLSVHPEYCSKEDFIYNWGNVSLDGGEVFITTSIKEAILLESRGVSNILWIVWEVKEYQKKVLETAWAFTIIASTLSLELKELIKELYQTNTPVYLMNYNKIDFSLLDDSIGENKKEYLTDILYPLCLKNKEEGYKKEIDDILWLIPLWVLKELYREILWDWFSYTQTKKSISNLEDIKELPMTLLEQILTNTSEETDWEDDNDIEKISLEELYNYISDYGYLDVFKNNPFLLGPITTNQLLNLEYNTEIGKLDRIDWLEDKIAYEEKIKII